MILVGPVRENALNAIHHFSITTNIWIGLLGHWHRTHRLGTAADGIANHTAGGIYIRFDNWMDWLVHYAAEASVPPTRDAERFSEDLINICVLKSMRFLEVFREWREIWPT